jgi:molecular chaperone DnaJ
MPKSDHYHTLNVSRAASQDEIKQAYRKLAKLFHPDINRETANHEKIAKVNAAYEVLGDPESRRHYDRQQQYQFHLETSGFATESTTRQERTASARYHYQQNSQRADELLQQWLNRVYSPVSRLIQEIIQPLQEQIDLLAADPFDDELMGDFQDYLDECRDSLDRAEGTFRSMPNPPSVAGVAASLYRCLNQINDGIEQFEFFTFNYDDYYLHTGKELFRIATGLRREAQYAAKEVLNQR